MLRLVTIFFLLALPLASASAQEIADPDSVASARDSEARGLFAAGEAAYSEGRFEEAYEYFQEAHELSRRPALLYNVGLSAANAGHDREALAAFESYLADVEDPPNRAMVESRVEALRRKIAEDEERARELAQAEARAQTESQRADSAGGGGMRTVGWALVVGGGVALVAGGVLFGVGMADVSTVEGAADGTDWTELSSAYDRAPVLTTIGLIAGGVGVAALATGLVLVLTSGSSESAVTLTPTGVSLRGKF